MAALTEARHAAAFILSEANGQYSRDTITIASGSGKVAAGTALGKVTANGKYKPSTATGSDGGETATALNIYEVDATSADVKVAAITRAAEVNANLLTYGSTVNDDTKKAAARAQLAAAGIVSR